MYGYVCVSVCVVMMDNGAGDDQSLLSPVGMALIYCETCSQPFILCLPFLTPSISSSQTLLGLCTCACMNVCVCACMCVCVCVCVCVCACICVCVVVCVFLCHADSSASPWMIAFIIALLAIIALVTTMVLH